MKLASAIRDIATHGLNSAEADTLLGDLGFDVVTSYKPLVYAHESGRLNIEFDDTNINFHGFEGHVCTWTVTTTLSTPDAVLNALVSTVNVIASPAERGIVIESYPVGEGPKERLSPKRRGRR